MKGLSVKPYWNVLTWTIRHWRVTLSLHLFWLIWDAQFHTRRVKRRASKRLRSLRTTRSSKPYLTVREKMLLSSAKLGSRSSQQQSEQGRSGSWTYLPEGHSLSHFLTTVHYQDDGQLPKAVPSTCRTSSVDRFYGRQSWPPKDTP